MTESTLLPVGTKVSVDTTVAGTVCFAEKLHAYNATLFGLDRDIIAGVFGDKSVGVVVKTTDDASVQRHIVENAAGDVVWVYDAMITEVQ